MPFPEPYAGLVIRYSYLWKREHEAGREDGTKDRPCAVVMAIIGPRRRMGSVGSTHYNSPPPDPADAIEIPAETKKRLGLDTDRSWIRITEANQFLRPGPDLRPVPGGDASTIAYGPLPPRFFAQCAIGFWSAISTKNPRKSGAPNSATGEVCGAAGT